MTDRTQPEAMDLADWLEAVGGGPSAKRCATLLREQHARIAELESELEAIGAGGVSGPLMGQPQAMPDLSQITERGAKAWAGVDAQELRDGGSPPSANAGEPSGHIKEPYTLAEIKAKIASNDYSAEMLLQHAMLLLDSVQEDAAREAIEKVLALFPFNALIQKFTVNNGPCLTADNDDEFYSVKRVLAFLTEIKTTLDAARKQGARWQSAVRALTLHI